MFSVFCPRHDHDVLLGPECILTVANGDNGIELHWRCWCGETGRTTFDRAPGADRGAA